MSMATESPIGILEGAEKWQPLKHSTRFGLSSSKITIEDLGLLIKDQRFQSLGKDVIPSRCESAPPSMECSKEAIENIFSQHKSTLCHSDLSSSSYHDSDVASDRKFAGPLDSKERYNSFQPSCSSDNDGKMTPHANILPVHEEGSEDDESSDQSACLPFEGAVLLGPMDTTRESSNIASSPTYDWCHSSNKSVEQTVVSDSISTAGTNDPLPVDVTRSVVVRSTAQEREVNTDNVDEQDNISTYTEAGKSVNITTAYNSNSKKFLKKDQPTTQNNMHQQHTSQVQGLYSQVIYPGITNSYGSPSQFYPNHQPPGFFTPQYNIGGYTFNSAIYPSYLPGFPYQGVIPLAFGGASFPASGLSNGGNVHMQNLKFCSQVGEPTQHSSSDLFHLQFLQLPVQDIYGTYGHFGHQAPGNGAVLNQADPRHLKEGADLVGLSNIRKSQHSACPHYNSSDLQRGNMPSQHSIGRPVVPVETAGGTNSPGGRYTMSHSHSSANHSKTYGLQCQRWKDLNSYSFLEELKSDKGQRFELSDIAGHISEFSVDQHGSRFIQQKLQTCSVEEKAAVFKEVIPNASKLITDVFGNYVIQKLFESGSPEQRMDLASKLEGQVLPLSLQMYGCRVIQKAVEVIDLEQKTRLIRELDGHVIRCVRDQNGNHVIQKCIEKIPIDNIHFLISSFHGQVAALSMHPYGCRVIQRVLEHYKDELQTQFIFDEILESVCSLAQDQYGNYVTQHVLERGKPHERSEIIEKISVSVVLLSQHKFASNVVEKCLEYSDSSSRGVLIEEIIGHGDNNDNLLIMMKDQYANYVVQKILQKCTSDQREVLLGLIKNHLTALKKYTYGKHIIARFEQLYVEADHPSDTHTSES